MLLPPKTKTEASLPPFFYSAIDSSLPQPSGRVGKQGIDHPGLRGEVAAQHRGPAFVARDLVEQALELGDVAVDRLLEVAVGAIFAGDLIEGLLAGRGVEPLGESLALAALIAIPHLGCEIAIHQAADVERQRVQRVATGCRLGRAAARDLTVAGAGIGAAQEVGKPPIASLIGSRWRNRRRFGAARNRSAEVRRRQIRRAAGISHAWRRRSRLPAGGGDQHRLFLVLRVRATLADDVEPAGVMCDDPVQCRQCLAMGDDNLAYLRGALGGTRWS